MTFLEKYTLPPIFLLKLLQKSWVSGMLTISGKKKSTAVFFFSWFSEKKNTPISKIEWVSGRKLFQGKKKYGPFGLTFILEGKTHFQGFFQFCHSFNDFVSPKNVFLNGPNSWKGRTFFWVLIFQAELLAV